MPTILLADHSAPDTGTSYPWMFVVGDEPEDDTFQFVVGPDDENPPEVATYQADVGAVHPSPAHALHAVLALYSQRRAQPPTDAPALLDELSVPSSHGQPTHPSSPPQRDARGWSFEQLDHGDPDEALAHCHLPLGRFGLLRAGLHKIEAYPERFARPCDHYRETLCLIALSDWDLAPRYCLCAIKNRDGYSQPCRLPNLCPSCSYWRRKRPTLLSYLSRFRRTSWYFVTISYVVQTGDGISDEGIVRASWEAAALALREHQGASLSRGTMSRLEMHLERFLPLQYLAHLHAIVDADRIDQRFLADRVFAYRHPDTNDRITFPVTIQDKPLRSERSFANTLSYAGKALDMATIYRASWPRAEAERRRLVPSLNQEVDEFLDAFSAFTADAHQVRYGGTMHASSRNSLRVPRAQRAAQQEHVDAILLEGALDPWDDDEDVTTTNIFPPPTT